MRGLEAVATIDRRVLSEKKTNSSTKKKDLQLEHVWNLGVGYRPRIPQNVNNKYAICSTID